MAIATDKLAANLDQATAARRARRAAARDGFTGSLGRTFVGIGHGSKFFLRLRGASIQGRRQIQEATDFGCLLGLLKASLGAQKIARPQHLVGESQVALQDQALLGRVV